MPDTEKTNKSRRRFLNTLGVASMGGFFDSKFSSAQPGNKGTSAATTIDNAVSASVARAATGAQGGFTSVERW